MEELLKMSNREIDRLKIIREVIEKKLKQKEASGQLRLSTRQVRRLCKRVIKQGNSGIMHQLRGRSSNHQLDAQIKQKAIKRVKERYADFGPTFAREKLASDGIYLSTTSLRNLMCKEGIWKAKTYRGFHRQWRERRNCMGELIQLDGSDHDWFESRAPRCALIAYIDDATSKIMHMEFAEVEDTLTLMRITKTYLQNYGRPLAFYVDRDSIYRTTRKACIEEQLQDKPAQTQFERAMQELNIGIICAYSPQAKGRVERTFQTHQDRLVKELRIRGISDQKTANRFLLQEYIPEHNKRFARSAAKPKNAHRALLASQNLDAILSVQEQRILAQDYTLQFRKQILQLEKNQPVSIRPKNSLTIEFRLDKTIRIRFKSSYLNFHKISCRPPIKIQEARATVRKTYKSVPPFIRWRQNKNKYPADHYSRY